MSRILLLLCVFSMAGCADMTPREKKWTYIAAGVVVAGAVAAHELDNGGRKDCPRNDCGHLVEITGP